MLVITFAVRLVGLALVIGERRNTGSLEDLHHEGCAGAGQPRDDGDDLLSGNAGEGLGVRLKHRHRSGLFGIGRNSVSSNSRFLLPKLLEPATALQGLDLVESLFGKIPFVPASNFSQHPKSSGEQRRLPHAKQEGVLALLPASKSV